MACFCHTDGLPHYHGRYPLPGNRRADELNYKLWQLFRRHIRSRVLGADLSAVNQELVWEFRTAGLEQVQIEGHLSLISPGDDRIPLEEGAAYALDKHEAALERTRNMQKNHGDELAEVGFSPAEFDELIELKRARDEYLQADPSRIREVMEVYTDALLFVKGAKP